MRTPEEQLEMQRLLSMATDLKCDKCGNLNFVEGFRIKKLSGLATGTGKDTIIPVPVFMCTDCGHVNDMFLKTACSSADEENKPSTIIAP